jgi:hypothetical protein
MPNAYVFFFGYFKLEQKHNFRRFVLNAGNFLSQFRLPICGVSKYASFILWVTAKFVRTVSRQSEQLQLNEQYYKSLFEQNPILLSCLI